MKIKTINYFMLTLFLVFFVFPGITYAELFKCVRVSDGDTFTAAGHDIKIRIRLAGIDTPETSKSKRKPGQPYSQRAKKYLAKLILNKTVDIKDFGTGPYNRSIAVVYVDGKNINLEMVKAGFAEVYQGKPPRNFDVKPYQEKEFDYIEVFYNQKRRHSSLAYLSPAEFKRHATTKTTYSKAA